MLQQEEQNRGKPNWEHLNDELHVLITVEDTENRAKVKLQRAVEEIKKLLVPAVSPLLLLLVLALTLANRQQIALAFFDVDVNWHFSYREELEAKQMGVS